MMHKNLITIFEEYKCPVCNFDLKGEEIPGERPGEYYLKIIGITDFFKDRMTQYLCPSCDELFCRDTGESLGKRGKIRG